MVLLPEFATQMLAPSKATPLGWSPTVNVPRRVPSLARSLVRVLLPPFAAQTLAPSKATPLGCSPTVNVPRREPSRARFVALGLLPPAAAPASARPWAPRPAGAPRAPSGPSHPRS